MSDLIEMYNHCCVMRENCAAQRTEQETAEYHMYDLLARKYLRLIAAEAEETEEEDE